MWMRSFNTWCGLWAVIRRGDVGCGNKELGDTRLLVCVWNRNRLKHNRRLNNNHAHVSWCHPCVYNYPDGRTSDNRPTASAVALLLPVSPFWCLSSRLSHSVSVSANILLNQQLWTQQCKVSVCQYSQHCGAPQMFFQHWLVMILRCHFLVSSLDIAQCNDNSTFFWLVKLIKSQ